MDRLHQQPFLEWGGTIDCNAQDAAGNYLGCYLKSGSTGYVDMRDAILSISDDSDISFGLERTTGRCTVIQVRNSSFTQ